MKRDRPLSDSNDSKINWSSSRFSIHPSVMDVYPLEGDWSLSWLTLGERWGNSFTFTQIAEQDDIMCHVHTLNKG